MWSLTGCFGGAKGSRTPDLLHAMQALSQLSYGPGTRTGFSPVPSINQVEFGPIAGKLRKGLRC